MRSSQEEAREMAYKKSKDRRVVRNRRVMI